MSFRFVLLFGSVRSERQGLRAARFVEHTLVERGHEVSLVDPRALDLPLLDRRYKDYPDGEAPKVLEELAGLYRAADGFVLVTAEYNHGLPPALKNLLDHFLEEYFFRPSAIVSYSVSDFGGIRAALQLRTVLATLGMPSIRSSLAVPRVRQAFAEDGTPSDPAWHGRISNLVGELEWYAEALRAQRAKGLPY